MRSRIRLQETSGRVETYRRTNLKQQIEEGYLKDEELEPWQIVAEKFEHFADSACHGRRHSLNSGRIRVDHPIPSSLVHLTRLKEVVPPSIGSGDQHEVGLDLVSKQASSICDDIPLFAPSADLLQAPLGSSTLSQSVCPDEDTFGDRIAIGRIYDAIPRRQVGVVAVAAGASGSDIRFEALEKYRFATHFKDGASSEYTSWKLSQNGYGLWNQFHAPIRHIVFSSEAGDYGSVLAVRSRTSVALFRPSLLAHALRPRKDPLKPSDPRMPVSRLDPRHFADIHSTELFGWPLAHMSFHPTKQRIAIIDTHGHWAIWSYEHDPKKHAMHQVRPEKCYTGFVDRDTWCPLYPDKIESSLDHNSWGRVTWSRDGRTFLAAGRRTNALYRFKSKVAERYCSGKGFLLVGFEPYIREDGGDQDRTDWLLDVKPCPSRPDALWILTSSRLYSVTHSRKAREPLHIDEGCIVRCASGFDDSSHWTLDLFAFSSTVIACIRGRQDVPVMAFTFQIYENAAKRKRVAFQGRFKFEMECQTGEGPISDRPLTGLAFLPTLNAQKGETRDFPNSSSQDCELVHLLYCSEALAVVDVILSYQSRWDERPSLKTVIRKSSRSRSSTSGRTIQDDFVVEDGLGSSDDEGDLLLIHRTRRRPSRSRYRIKVPRDSFGWLRQRPKDIDGQDISAAAKLEELTDGVSELRLLTTPGEHTIDEILENRNAFESAAELENIVNRIWRESAGSVSIPATRNRTNIFTTILQFHTGLSGFVSQSWEPSSTARLLERLQKASPVSQPGPIGYQMMTLLARQHQDIARKSLLTSRKLLIPASKYGLASLDNLDSGPQPQDILSQAELSSMPLLKNDLHQQEYVEMIAKSDGNINGEPKWSKASSFPALSDLGILQDSTENTIPMSQVKEQWKLGRWPTGQNWRHYGTHARAIRPTFLAPKEINNDKLRPPTIISSQIGPASSQPASSQPKSSQPRPAQLKPTQINSSQPESSQPVQAELVHRPTKIPFGLQALRIIADPGTNPLNSSQTKRTSKKRKAGF